MLEEGRKFCSGNCVKGTKSKGSLKMVLFTYRLALKLKLQVIIKHDTDAEFIVKEISCKVFSTIENQEYCV